MPRIDVGGFGSVGEWHPLLESVEVLGAGTGAMRVAHSKEDGDGRTIESVRRFLHAGIQSLVRRYERPA